MIRASMTKTVAKADLLSPVQRPRQVSWLERLWQYRKSIWTTYPSPSCAKLVLRGERLCMRPECEQLPFPQLNTDSAPNRSRLLNMRRRVFVRWRDLSAKTCHPIYLDRYNRIIYNVPFMIPGVGLPLRTNASFASFLLAQWWQHLMSIAASNVRIDFHLTCAQKIAEDLQLLNLRGVVCLCCHDSGALLGHV